jgi:glc operon protein GlcG
MKRTALGISLALTLTAGAWAANLADKKAMTLDIARQIAAAAEKTAVANKWTFVIAILDDGGNLVYLERMDDTQLGSIEVAVDKGRSAVKFKRPTKAFEDAVAGGRNALLKLTGGIPIEGGIPLTVDGKIIGAIGVSGMASNQDGVAAQAGVDALPKILGK